MLRSDILKTIFRQVDILNADISPKDDVYIRVKRETELIPSHLTYGSASGPNLQFFKTIEYCKKYNTILLLKKQIVFYSNHGSRNYNYIQSIVESF
jgi:hypothetical protein